MINFVKKVFIFIVFSLLIAVFLTNPNLIIDSVNYSVSVFLSNVFPSMFSFFILTDVLINYNYVYYLNRIFRFKYSYLILMSLISGLPSNAKYVKSLLVSNEISLRDANVILSLTFFPNPMFVIGSVGSLMLGSVRLGVVVLLSVYLANFIMYLFYYKSLGNKRVSFLSKPKGFTSLLRESVISNFKTLIVILGTIVVFTTLSNVLFEFFSAPKIIEGLVTGFFEMTSGIKKLSVLGISTQSKLLLISVLLSFSGMSVLCQAFSILSEIGLDFKFILKNKFFVVLLTFFINYFYIIFWM